MPLNDAQIRETIENVLATYPGAFYGATQNARNANGNTAFTALIQAAVRDIETAAQAQEDDCDLAS